MKTKTLLAAAVASLLAAGSVRAATIYIGDDAAEGHNVTSGGGTQADTANPLTYAFTGTGSTYTAATAQSVVLTEVNFFADEGPGNLTPYVAVYNGGSNQTGANYKVLAIGDAIAVTGSVFGSAGNVLDNAAFTVGGVNPTVNLNAGDVLIAGLYQTSRIVLVGGTGTTNDYIHNGNSIPASAGNTLTGDSNYSLNRTLRFNVGLTPEPSTACLSVLAVILLAGARRRKMASLPW